MIQFKRRSGQKRMG